MGRPNMSGVEEGISIVPGGGLVFSVCNKGIGLSEIIERGGDEGPAEGGESSSLRIILLFGSI